jgi:uncharacterized protein YndB with AHSA1/START domain
MSLFIKNTIIIHGTPAEVWNVLTNPHETKQYMYGCETVSTWEQDATLLWQAPFEGENVVFVKGHIEVIHPPFRLIYTVFDPLSTMRDIRENYLTVTYTLAEKGDSTELTVTQGDYDTVEDGERRYHETMGNSGEGWQPILLLIKAQVEAAHKK